jgi:hypothetical protein
MRLSRYFAINPHAQVPRSASCKRATSIAIVSDCDGVPVVSAHHIIECNDRKIDRNQHGDT